MRLLGTVVLPHFYTGAMGETRLENSRSNFSRNAKVRQSRSLTLVDLRQAAGSHSHASILGHCMPIVLYLLRLGEVCPVLCDGVPGAALIAYLARIIHVIPTNSSLVVLW
jgi:hypothetical protein